MRTETLICPACEGIGIINDEDAVYGYVEPAELDEELPPGELPG
jgi:hypothetical protein